MGCEGTLPRATVSLPTSKDQRVEHTSPRFTVELPCCFCRPELDCRCPASWICHGRMANSQYDISITCSPLALCKPVRALMPYKGRPFEWSFVTRAPWRCYALVPKSLTAFRLEFAESADSAVEFDAGESAVSC